MSYVCLYLKNGQQVTGIYKESEEKKEREGLLKQDIISGEWISLTPAVILKVAGVTESGDVVLDAMPFPLGGTPKTTTEVKGSEVCGYCFFDEPTCKYIGELLFPSPEVKEQIMKNIKAGIEKQQGGKKSPLIIPVGFAGQIPLKK